MHTKREEPTMNNLISKAAILMTAAVFALVAMSPASAQTSAVRANVPFEFHAGNQLMPAGEYQIALDPVSRRVEVRGVEGGAGAYLAASQSTDAGEVGASLAFHRYGNTYFLREVRNGGSLSYSWGPSKTERSTSRQMNVQVAVVRVSAR
jgi:hypothetical protein